MSFQSITTAFIAATALSAPAHAAIVIYTLNPGALQPSENVLFNDSTPQNPLTALTNGGTSVTFLGGELLQSFASGQARITGADGNISALEFRPTLASVGFSQVEFLLNQPTQGSVGATVTFFDQFGIGTSATVATLPNGNAWFSAEGTGGSIISRVLISATANLDDVRQVRVNGVEIPAVPEPATWAMMISGFGLIGCAMRRRTTKLSFA